MIENGMIIKRLCKFQIAFKEIEAYNKGPSLLATN
jgi:hypothetical protein